MRNISLALAIWVLSLSVSYAQPLQLAHIFTDHAVLQRETTTQVWGWGQPGAQVKVSGSWNGKAVNATVAQDGAWRVSLETLKADGKAYTLTVKSGKESLTVNDVVFGEVWLCSGQSNMQMPLSGFGFQRVAEGMDAILNAQATASKIRVFDIRTDRCTEPIKDVEAQWNYSTPSVAAGTSAVAYFFAHRLAQNLDVPVGIIVNPWGGSRIEPWMTWEAIEGAGLTQEELAAIHAINEKPDWPWPETPEHIWNGRVKPIAGYAAKGIIWYQGCSNINQRYCYDKLQKAMVELWRKEWGRDLPFIFTLLAPYTHDDANGRWRPFFVLNQLHTQEILTNSWAVCAETLGDETTIHPAQKRPIGDMMCQRALQNVYGVNPGMCIELPRVQSIEYLEDGRVKVLLTNVWSNLLDITARDIKGFELAGEDRAFHLAQAQVDWDGQTIYVQCPEVPQPVAVRYSFRNWMGANLETAYGIPVPPFKSDDWED